MTRVDFSRRLSRTAVRWLALTLLLVVGTGVWAVVGSGEDPLLVTALLGGFVAVFAGWALRSRQWLELGGDEPVLVQRRLLTTRRVGLRTARAVRLRTNYGGSLQLLAVPPAGRGSSFAPVLLLSLYAEVAQPVEVHDALVAALEGSPAPGAREAAEQLRQQAAHLRAGGSPAGSPLARLVVDALPGGRGRGGLR